MFQALQAALLAARLDAQHVHGHAGDPWNEIADCLAETAATKGHKLAHQKLDLKAWKQALPHMWML